MVVLSGDIAHHFRHSAQHESIVCRTDEASTALLPPGIGDRYLHDADMEKLFLLRYDQHIDEAVEGLTNTLPGHERRVLRARYVSWPHLADELIARRLGLPARNLDTLLLAAHLHFGQHWLQWQQGAA